jgi:HEAT repeat protein
MKKRKRLFIFLGLCLTAIVLISIRQVKIAALFKQVNSNDMTVRVEAVRLLLEKDIIPRGLPAQKAIIRSKISPALAQIGSQEAIDTLISLLNDIEDSPWRWASNSLARMGPPALPALSEVLLTGSERSKKAALDTLSRMGPPAVPFLRRLMADPAARADACTALGNIAAAAKSPEAAEAALTPLIQAASSPDLDLAGAAIPVLGDKRVQAAVEPLRKALEADSLRRNAIIALGEIGDSRATQDLIPFLSDSSIDLRTATVRALGQIADPRAAAPLVATIAERHADYNSALTLALQRIGAPAAALLVDKLHSPDVHVRRSAAKSLWGAAVPSTIPYLRQALSDPDAEVRAAAARALGWEGNTPALPDLLQALHDEDGVVVDAAIEALAGVGPSATPTLFSLFSNPDPTFALYASRALVGMGEPAVPRLMEALDSPQPQVRLWAAITLTDMGEHHAVPKLQRLYADSQGTLRVILERGLSELGASLPGQPASE